MLSQWQLNQHKMLPVTHADRTRFDSMLELSREQVYLSKPQILAILMWTCIPTNAFK